MQTTGQLQLFTDQKLKKLITEKTFVPADEQKSSGIRIPYAKINPNYIVFYDWEDKTRNYNTDGLKLNHSNTGELSHKGSKRIKEIISWFTELSRDQVHIKAKKQINYRLTFATLTLPAKQDHSDQYIKKNLLSRFLIYAGRYWGAKNYFWRAESQENGNIHFHITFDKYIEHSELRKVWNEILSDHGYIKRYSEKMKNFFSEGFRVSDNKHDKRTEEQQREAYKTGVSTGWTNPNTTDIHSLYKVKNVAGYLAKYVSKNIKIFEIKTNLKYWKIEQIFKNYETKVSINMIEGGARIKLNGTDLKTVENYLMANNFEFTEISEIKIRPIEGRLWFASDAIRKLKNVTVELTADIGDGVAELIKQAGVERKEIMVKNKMTGLPEIARFASLFIGKIFSFIRTEINGIFKHDYIIDGNAVTVKSIPVLQRITENVKLFFQ